LVMPEALKMVSKAITVFLKVMTRSLGKEIEDFGTGKQKKHN
jgi:hypothetical protein